MKRNSLILLLISILLPGLAHALGLGELELKSGLNQPFEARIQLFSATADDLDSLNVGLADSDAFRRSGVDRPFILSKLKFKVIVSESGSDYLRIYSKETIREPYLNFLIEASWSKGRLFREYTVLLDPPIYDLKSRSSQSKAATISTPISPQTAQTGQQIEPVSPPPAYSTSEPAGRPDELDIGEAEDETTTGMEGEQESAATDSSGTDAAGSSQPAPMQDRLSGDTYGPVEHGDTLWSLSKRWRSDSSVTIQQMMLALLRTNPDAFIDGNINGLKRGHVLRFPDSDEFSRMSDSEALAEVKSQYALWDEARGNIAAATSERPITADAGESSGEGESTGEMVASGAGEEDSELRLLAASESGATVDLGGGTEGERRENLNQKVALANEQLAAITQENDELKDRVTEAEGIIGDLNRLIELKDNELAAMQQQVIDGASQEDVAADAGSDTGEEAEPADGKQQATEQTDKDIAVVEEQPVSPGMLDSVMAVISENLLIIVGALAAILIAVGLMVTISRRKSAVSAAAGLPAEFPDFTGSEEETYVPDEGEAIAGPGSEEKSADDTDDIDTADAERQVAAEAFEPAPTLEMDAQGFSVETAEDPLAEVNVFLAYEHFDQAEEFVRDAISREPNNLEFHSKLLEIFYASGNKKGYEDAARVLHDKVKGKGPHWDNALTMWNELSPNRAIFEAAGEAEEIASTTSGGGGMLDITAVDSDRNDRTASGLDFDLGEEDNSSSSMGTDATGNARDEILNITADQEDGILDVTAGLDEDDDILDVTAAVGLGGSDDDASEDIFSMTAQEQELLDMTSGGGGGSLLGSSDSDTDDLLDITSHANLESEGLEDDLLDVTAATSAGADADALLDAGLGEGYAANDSDDNALEFDLGEFDVDDPDSSGDTGNMLDFDVGMTETSSSSSSALDLNIEEESGSGEFGEEGTELDLSMNFDTEETSSSGSALDMDIGLDMDEQDQRGQTLDLDMSMTLTPEEREEKTASGLEVDLSIEDETPEADINSDTVTLGVEQINAEGLDFDLTLQDSGLSRNDLTLMGDADSEIDGSFDQDADDDSVQADMESTVEMPKLDMDIGDDEEPLTVFVPRSSDPDEQSSEDEMATKLDLAKAYVELGDKDSAKSILEDVIAGGSDDQRTQAQELMGQI